MRRAIRPSLTSAFLIAALLISPAACAETPKAFKITLGRDTTYITEPLNPDGTPNYVAATNAHYGKGVTPDNNAAVLVLEALGPKLLQNPETHAEVFRLLGMAPLKQEGRYFVPFKDYANARLGADEQLEWWPAAERVQKLRYRPWNTKDDPLVAKWLQSNAWALDLIVSASRRTRWFIPKVSPSDPPTLYDCSFTSWRPLMAAARALGARAMLRLGRGEIDLAFADIQAIRRLSVLVAGGPILVDVLIALGLDGLGNAGDNALARSGALTAPQLRRRLAEVAAAPEVAGMPQCLRAGERFFTLDMWALCARKSARQVLGSILKFWQYPLESVPDYPLDWDEILRLENAWIDRNAAIYELPTFRQRREAMKAQDEEIARIVGADKKAYALKMVKRVNAKPRPDLTEISRATFYYLEGCSGPPSRLGIMEVENMNRARRGIVVASLALAVWRAEKGRYPGNLAALSPSCLKAIPLDAFTDKPLIYRRKGNDYILYSLGPNMKDDGGIRDEENGADDIDLDSFAK